MLGASGSNDVTMGSHSQIVHYAPLESKCLLHHQRRYVAGMDNDAAGARLAQARKRHFSSVAEASRALDVPYATYRQHETGERGFKAEAEKYARRFGTSPEWLLYARGDELVDVPVDPVPTEDALEQMLQEAIRAELLVGAKVEDLPRILAPALRAQLERALADRGVSDLAAEKSARGKRAQSPVPTKAGDREESRNP